MRSSPGGPVAITGAGGFVGQHLLARFASRCPETQIHAIAADLLDADALAREVATLRPAICIHLGALSSVAACRDDPDLAWRVNLGGTLALARAILDHAPACALLFASTADAYGGAFATGEPASETTALAPLNTYAATKAAADLALGALAASAGLRAIRLRPFNHTGPGQSDAFAVAAFARQIARIEAALQPPVIQVGDLSPQRDFLDVRDVCDAYLEAAARAPDLPPGLVLNLCSGEPRRIGDVLDSLLALSPVRPRIEPDPARLRRADIPLARGDAAAARLRLGWWPRIAWSDTLGAVLNDWRARTAAEAAAVPCATPPP